VTDLSVSLEEITKGLNSFIPELILSGGILSLIFIGLFKRVTPTMLTVAALVFPLFSLWSIITDWTELYVPVRIFNGFLRADDFGSYLKILFDVSCVFTVLMTWRRQNEQLRLCEYYAVVLAVLLGAHLLAMSMNLIMVFISLELVSIGSYILAGVSFSKKGSEGSFKYFLFGSTASAIMLYGFSFLYGFTGTLDFSSSSFADQMLGNQSILLFIACIMAMAGFFYKIAAAPLHLWSPDVYEAAPFPIIAFFSVVPKLAGIAILTRFTLALNAFGQSTTDWQFILSIIAILSVSVGNFSALGQKNPKRLMAYSSIAQSGFLMVGIVAFSPNGMHYMLFYASVYTLANFLVFNYLQCFDSLGMDTLPSFAGAGKKIAWPMILTLIGLITLTGLPPTSGFTAKLFVFSSLWEAYQVGGKTILLWLLVFGLLNTVVSLFYYLSIPYYAFIKGGEKDVKTNNLTFENLFGALLVLAILLLFFNPELLMGWINKINFVL
jgi:NADH-quinone oxidoreductase subunit N